MNWLTLVLIAVLVLLTYRAWRNGFVRELVSLSAAILAIPIAGLLYGDMYRKVNPIVDNPDLARLVSFLAILAGVIVAGQIGAHLLKRTVNLLNLGTADQVAGGIFGFLKGLILCQVILIALVAFPSPDFRAEIDKSPLARRLIESTPLVLAFLPATFDRAVEMFSQSGRTAPGAPPTPTPVPTR